MNLLGVSGSLRRGSYSTALLRAAGELLPPGVELELLDGLKDVPPFDEDDEAALGEPAAVTRIVERIRAADALLVVTAEYNGSVPGQLKNALDWVSRPFETNALRGRRVALASVSTGMFGGAWAQNDLKRVLGTMGARVTDGGVLVPKAQHAFDAGGTLVDDAVREALRDHLHALCGVAAATTAA